MYLTYWGMHSRPFENGHEPAFFVPYEGAALALAKLRYAVTGRLGVVCLTGGVGVGKTELARMTLYHATREGWLGAYVPAPGDSQAELFGLLADLLGVSAGGAPLERLLLALKPVAEAGRSVAVVMDDAHTVKNPAVFEGLRMLLNIEHNGHSLIGLVLAGQDGFVDRLSSVSGFSSHFGLKSELRPMTLDEAKMYVLYRLKVAGCSRGIFTRHAAERIHQLSGGQPRNVNRLCELALTTACGLQLKKVGPEVVDEVAGVLGLEEDILAKFGNDRGEDSDVLADLGQAALA